MEDKVRKDLREIRLEGVELIHMGQDTDQWRVMNTVINFRIP
jgi:hypothetical protein